MPIVKGATLALTFEEIAQYPGLRCRGLARSKSADLLRSHLKEINSQSLFQPDFAYNIVPLEHISQGCMYLPGNKVLPAPIAAHRLKRASHVVLAVCTLGEEIDSAISQLFHRKKRFHAMIMEELSNYALFKLSGLLEERVTKEADGLGLMASGPLSPGDDGFELSAQQLIIDLAGAADIGVNLSSGQMMNPRHSVSILYGLGKQMPQWTHAQNCEDCSSRERCKHRLVLAVAT